MNVLLLYFQFVYKNKYLTIIYANVIEFAIKHYVGVLPRRYGEDVPSTVDRTRSTCCRLIKPTLRKEKTRKKKTLKCRSYESI